MILNKRSPLLWLVSSIVFRIPGRAASKMAEFAHTEAGSALDMLAAAEETNVPSLRAKFFRHALDERRHARMFTHRASVLANGRQRVRAVLEDAGYLLSHGIRSKESLHTQMTDAEFFAFIWVAEMRGAQQFDVYASLMASDSESAAMFAEIGNDERFHISYSRKELDRMIADGRGKEVRRAIRKVRRQRFAQAWLRVSRRIGDVMSGLWLTLAYFVVIGPFALIVRATERIQSGFVPVADARSTAAESQT